MSLIVGKCEATESSLADLLAERDIRNQIHNYARAQDRFDNELFASVGHYDCYINYGGVGLTGRKQPQGAPIDVIKIMNEGHSEWQSHLHHVSNITIKVKGDRAVSETYVHATLFGYPNESGKRSDMNARGRYLDTWSKRDGRWAMDGRTLVSECIWRSEADAGRLGSEGNPTRDRNDPVYAHFAQLD